MHPGARAAWAWHRAGVAVSERASPDSILLSRNSYSMWLCVLYCVCSTYLGRNSYYYYYYLELT